MTSPTPLFSNATSSSSAAAKPSGDTTPRSIQGETEYTDRDVAAWLASLPDDFILCRLYGHGWRPTNWAYTSRQVASRTVHAQDLACPSCGTEKEDRIQVLGSRKKRVEHDTPAMHYVEGYLAPKGMQVTKSDVRQEWARRRGVLR